MRILTEKVASFQLNLYSVERHTRGSFQAQASYIVKTQVHIPDPPVQNSPSSPNQVPKYPPQSITSPIF